MPKTSLVFKLAAAGAQGVVCSEDGLYVGGVALLSRTDSSEAEWQVRPLARLNEELSWLYGLPVDASAKLRAQGLPVSGLPDHAPRLAGPLQGTGSVGRRQRRRAGRAQPAAARATMNARPRPNSPSSRAPMRDRRLTCRDVSRWMPAVCAVLLATVACASARAETGRGDAIRGPATLPVTAFLPTKTFGADALRVTVNTDAHFRWTVTLHPQDGHWAVGEFAVLLQSPHSASVWAFETLRLRRDAYENLVAKADSALARGDPPEFQGPQPGDLVVCTDYPPIYTVERRSSGHTHWTRETCASDMPAADVAQLIAAAFPTTVCPFSRDLSFDVCKISAPRDGSPSE